MFYYIFELFGEEYSFLRIFSYVTFRAMMATLTSFFLTWYFGERIIQFLYSLKFRESIRDDGPKSHDSKKGTPTMGGLMIAGSAVVSIALWGNLQNHTLLLLIACSLGFCALGFTDDYMKAIKKIKGGMRARTKFLSTVVIAVFFAYAYYYITGKANPHLDKGIVFQLTDLFVPFIKGPVFPLGMVAVFFGMVVILASSHSVNLTDGLDGLATGTVIIAVSTFAIISYVHGTPLTAYYLNLPYLPGAHEYTVYLTCLVGSLIGFLWYNSHPAQVFMGDTGSLFLGSSLGMVAVILKKEILLVLLGGVFVMEAASVILQVASFKLTGKRIFKMSPIHHHFELSGWAEEKIVIRFWILGILFAILTLATFKIQ